MSLLSFFLTLEKTSPISSLLNEIASAEMASVIARKQLLFSAENMKGEKYNLTTQANRVAPQNAKSIPAMCIDIYTIRIHLRDKPKEK
jgi:hypothetical protein